MFMGVSLSMWSSFLSLSCLCLLYSIVFIFTIESVKFQPRPVGGAVSLIISMKLQHFPSPLPPSVYLNMLLHIAQDVW